MHVAGFNDNCQSVPKDSGIHNTENTKQYLESTYDHLDGQLWRWHDEMRVSSSARVRPQQSFTQVTIPACERRKSRHGDSYITHEGPHKQRLLGDLVKSLPSSGHKQQEFQHCNSGTPSYYETTDQTDALHIAQCAGPMLLNTYTCASGAFQHQPDNAAYQAANPIYMVEYGGTSSSQFDHFSPPMPRGLPPTPTDTIEADEQSRKRFSTDNVSPIASPPECELALGRNDAPSAIIAISTKNTDNAVGRQHESRTFLTPPPERAEEPSKHITQSCYRDIRDTCESNETESEKDARAKRNEAAHPNSSPVLFTNEDDDLDFLSSDWDPDNFDFLSGTSGFAPTFTSNQTNLWQAREDFLPSHYQPSALVSNFSTGASFPAHSGFASEIRHNYNFDGFEGQQPCRNPSTGLDIFQASCPPFETHGFEIPQTSTSQANDQTSHRSRSKDQMLVDLKQRGYSYKDIKTIGQFEEAESTLRGRYRTLTKPKEARVRKPEWGDREIALLMQGVAAHANTTDEHSPVSSRSASKMCRRAAKIPWKQVSEYMALRGAYKYGNATVKKKWMEVVAARCAQ